MMTKTCTKCGKEFETEKEEQVMCQECLAAQVPATEGQAPVAGTPEAPATPAETPAEPTTE